MLTVDGTASSSPNFSISAMMLKPFRMRPNTTFDPSKCGDDTEVMKNCELFECGRP